MTNKIKIAIISLIMIGGIAATTIQNDKLFEISKNLEIFISAYKELNTNFADELDPSILMRTAIDAMTKSLDPYTNFVSESQSESYWINEDDKYQGIGAKVGIINSKFRVLEPYEGGPSLLAGIKAGDEIVSIDGVRLEGKSMEEANNILRGIQGSTLKLGIKSYGNNQVIEKILTRGEVNIPNVPYSGFVDDNIGYMSLTVFTQAASGNLIKAYKEMKNQNPNLSGIILDLRQNGGGLLFEAVNICNIFIPTGETVVTTKSKIKERDQIFKTTAQPTDLDIPLVVLIDNRSASASEIVSGVIQDLDRGVIMGQRSYGKGLVQNTKKLPYNAQLKLTTSKYYIPSGRCIQSVEYENGEPKNIPDNLRTTFKTRNGRPVLDGGGVTPDIVLESNAPMPITKALIDQFIIFEYVNKFCANKDSIDQVGKFSFQDWKDFTKFLEQSKFEYISESEKHLTDALVSLKKDNKADIASELESLKSKLKTLYNNDLEIAKSQILNEINKEIVARYYFQKGKTKQSLSGDLEVKQAIALLKDTNKYNSILKAKSR